MTHQLYTEPPEGTQDWIQGDVVALYFGYVAGLGDPPWPAVRAPKIPAFGPILCADIPSPHRLQLRAWRGFGMVISHSCDIDNRQLNVEAGDPRILVAPLFRRLEIGTKVDWNLISKGKVECAIPVPELPKDILRIGHPGFPESAVELRGIVAVSPSVLASRLLRPTANFTKFVQYRLARFFTWRDLARPSNLANLKGKSVVEVAGFQAGDREVTKIYDSAGNEYTVLAFGQEVAAAQSAGTGRAQQG